MSQEQGSSFQRPQPPKQHAQKIAPPSLQNTDPEANFPVGSVSGNSSASLMGKTAHEGFFNEVSPGLVRNSQALTASQQQDGSGNKTLPHAHNYSQATGSGAELAASSPAPVNKPQPTLDMPPRMPLLQGVGPVSPPLGPPKNIKQLSPTHGIQDQSQATVESKPASSASGDSNATSKATGPAPSVMSIRGDPSKPLGSSPPLVGLSQVTFDRTTMNISEMDSDIRINDDDNYIKQSLDHFYPCGASRSAEEQKFAKVALEQTRQVLEKLKNNTRSTWRTLDLEVTVPMPMVVEQVQLQLALGLATNQLCSFSTYFKVLNVSASTHGQGSSLILKSAFSEFYDNKKEEKKTSENFVEINTCGVVGGPAPGKVKITLLCIDETIQRDRHILESVGLLGGESSRVRAQAEQSCSEDAGDELDQEVARIFANKQSEQQMPSIQHVKQDAYRRQPGGNATDDEEMEDEEDIQAQVKKGIFEEEDDDMRILDSLPDSFLPLGDQNQLLLKRQSSDNDSSPMKRNRRSNEQIDNEATPRDQQQTNRTQYKNTSIYRVFLDFFLRDVTIHGFNTNSIPAITNLTYFMNQGFLLRSNKRKDAAQEIDFLVGVLLISTKRSVQTSEVFRRIQADILGQVDRNIKEKGATADNTRNYMRCAVLELLIAESMCIETQINEKMQALVRMVRFSDCCGPVNINFSQPLQMNSNKDDETGVPSPLEFSPQLLVQDDAFSMMLRILPKLLSFLVVCLSHRREIVQISALKILKFVLETQGCSLDHGMVFILKGMLQTFPKKPSHTQQQQQQQSAQNSSMNKEQQPPVSDEGFPGRQASTDQQNTSNGSTEGSTFFTGNLSNNQSSPQKGGQNGSNHQSVLFQAQRNSFDLSLLFDKSDKNQMDKERPVNEILRKKFIGHSKSPDSEISINLKSIQEPSSGFQNALYSVYQHVLETYISVLSSISSHILHAIFYEVIEPILLKVREQIIAQTKEPDLKEDPSAMAPQVVVFTVKIAEKIITICQGDLLLSHALLDMLVSNYTAPHKVTNQANQQKIQSLKNLWQSVRQKVFPNYSSRGSRSLLNWILKKFQQLAETPSLAETQAKQQRDNENKNFNWNKNSGGKPTRPRKSSIASANQQMIELNEQETGYLSQLCDIVAIVSVSKQKMAEEEANQLIKLPVEKIGKCGTAAAELYLTIPALLFWMEYSIDREDRLALFQQLYQTIKDVLTIMPRPGYNKRRSTSPRIDNPNYEVDLNLVQVMMPTLERTSDFLFGNSPSLPMLKFLEITLTDVTTYFRVGKTTGGGANGTSPRTLAQYNLHVPEEMKIFFLGFVSNFVQHISYSLYEEVFPIFDKLLALTGDLVDEQILRKCIVSLVDKYTIKSKYHKASLTQFMKTLMDVQLKIAGSPSNHMMDTFEKTQNKKFGEFEEPADLSGVSYYGAGGQRSTYFEVMSDFCYFQNGDVPRDKSKSSHSKSGTLSQSHHAPIIKHGDNLAQLDFRGPADLHDLFVDKMQFFIDSLSLLNETHINLFTNLITHPCFKPVLLSLIEHGETQIRLKSHEILEVLTAYFVHYCPSKTVYEFEDGRGEGKEGGGKPKSGALSSQSPGATSENIMDAEFISHERLYISQIVIKVARKSLEQSDDCYLQFNALISLDFLFQKLLPVPTFANEQVKRTRANIAPHQPAGMSEGAASAQAPAEDALDMELTLDIEALSLNEKDLQQFPGQMSPISPTKHECLFSAPELDVLDPRYLKMRMKLVLSLWPHIHAALNSPWSNIRSVCYGLICSIFKIDVRDYPNLSQTKSKAGQANFSDPPNIDFSETTSLGLSDILSQNMGNQPMPTSAKLKSIILPMLYGLLSSKESESKAGGLNILGSFCGLSYDFSAVNIQKYRHFFQRNSTFVSLPIWRLVYELQDDWDITIKEASVVLVQLCAPRNAICYFEHLRQEKEKAKVHYMFNNMPRVSLVYAPEPDEDEEDSSEQELRQRPTNLVTSGYAKKAFGIFPTQKDRLNILESIKEEENEEEQPLEQNLIERFQKYEAFLLGKRKPALYSMVDGVMPVNCAQIDNEHAQLEGSLSEYEPIYQSALQASKPLSRKRQLEIELDIRGSRGASNAAKEQQNAQGLPVNFFVDLYSDDQIQEIISIFRNDFQPPKNLWIEKQPNSALVQGNSRQGMSGGPNNSLGQQANGSNSPDFYADIYAEAIEQFNQLQIKLQMEQQATLQQQVASGSSNPPSPAPSAPATPDQAPAASGAKQPDNEDGDKNGDDSEQKVEEKKVEPEPMKPDLQPSNEVIKPIEEVKQHVDMETQTMAQEQQQSPKPLNLLINNPHPPIDSPEKESPVKEEVPVASKPSKAKPKKEEKKKQDKFQKKKQSTPMEALEKTIEVPECDNIMVEMPSYTAVAGKKKLTPPQSDVSAELEQVVMSSRPPKKQKKDVPEQVVKKNNFFTEKTSEQQTSSIEKLTANQFAPPVEMDQMSSSGLEDNEAQPVQSAKSKRNRERELNKKKKMTQAGPMFTAGRHKKNHLELADNDYFIQDDKQFSHLKLNTMKNQPLVNIQKAIGGGTMTSDTIKASNSNQNSNSTPDFSLLPRAFKKTTSGLATSKHEAGGPRKPHQATNSSGSQGNRLEASGGSGGNENNFISRKTAQTFLSGLSHGYIKNIDNMKLIKSCLSGSGHQTTRVNQATSVPKETSATQKMKSQTVRVDGSRDGHLSEIGTMHSKTAGTTKAKKIMNKSFENLTSANRLSIKTGNAANVLSAADSILNSHSSNLTYHSTKNQKLKKTTLSSSPKIRSAGTASTNVHSRKPSSTRASKKAISSNKRAAGGGGGALLNSTSSGNAMPTGLPHSNSDSKSTEGYTRNSYNLQGKGIGLLNTSNAAVAQNQNTSAGGVNPVGTSLCDLNFFIKTIERDLSERFQHMQDIKSAGQTAQTPNSLLRKVESQMRSLGIDLANSKKIAASVASGALRNASPTDVQTLIKKLENDNKGKTSSASSKHKSLLPKLKLIALNQQIQNKAEQTGSHKNLTPSNVSLGSYMAGPATNTVSPGKDGSTGAASSFTKTWRGNEHNTALSFRHNMASKGIKTQRDRSEPNSKDRSGQGGSSDSRGRTGSSGPHSIQFPQPTQMVMTERSHRVRGTGISHHHSTARPTKTAKNATLATTQGGFDSTTSARQVKFQPPEGTKAAAKSKSQSKYNSTAKNKLLSPGADEKVNKKSIKQALHQSGESLSNNGAAGGKQKGSGSRLQVSKKGSGEARTDKNKKHDTSQQKASGLRGSRVNHTMIDRSKKQQPPTAPGAPASTNATAISSPGQVAAPMQKAPAKMAELSAAADKYAQQPQPAQKNSTLLDILNQQQQDKKVQNKSATRYTSKHASGSQTGRGADKPKQIEYYSPIQLTGRFMDSSSLVTSQVYGSSNDALDNAGSPPLGEQKAHQQHNSQGAPPTSGGSGSGSNPNRKQGGAFTGRDPRKPPMLQPTHYY